LHNGELPGTCAHFIIDRDGTIYQLVHLWIRCRHTVGMNYRDRDRARQDERSDGARRRGTDAFLLTMTLWLMARYHINIGNVVGHNETLYSPYRLGSTHRGSASCADFPHWAMKEVPNATPRPGRQDGACGRQGAGLDQPPRC
jgi:beta-N-acetylhexosaminidase